MLSARPTTAPGPLDLFPAKTPARSKSRAENVVRHGAPMTVHKGKIQRTPFPQSARLKKHASVNFKEGVSGTGDAMGGKPVVLNTRPAARPLGDKTPFPNRARKASTGQDMDMQKGELQQKLPKLLESLYPSLSSRGETLDLSPRPSSTRKSARTPNSANRKFQTPLVNGNPWDVSEGSIELGDVQLQDAQQDAEVEDLDEIEYMPPNTLDLPYQPPFDFELPNYEQVGKSLWSLLHSCPADDTPPPEHEPDLSHFKPDWDLLPTLKNLSEDVDDPFYRAKAPPTRKTTTKANAPRPASGSKTTRNIISRTVSSTSVKSSTSAAATTATTTATKVGMSRPATASGAVGRPVTRSVSAKAGTMKVAAEAPRRPASVAAVRGSSRPLGTSGAAGKPRAASTMVTKRPNNSSRESVRARGPTGSTTDVSKPLKGIKEEQGASAGGIIPGSMLEITDDFLFEV
ncbi:hypothetical protein AX14_014033 [Amanita brunnescens Koide BX004]|nr:hypothetical protein AX14_014033 [Amanita brunnescens Koide BX004]